MDEQGIKQLAAESVALKQRFFEANAGLLVAAGRRMAECLRAGGKVLAFGNGGSAADAQHLAGELVGRFLRDRAALSAIALTTDASVTTAIANDTGYDAVFRRQVEAHGRPGDVAVGITTSGRSPNVVLALQLARERGLVTIGLTGGGGGRLAGAVDYLIDVPHTATARIQEVHVMVVHILCQIVEEAMPRG
ncbi:MAG: phosphoheptose isomerase [Acidobacteria bacterium]|nr:MAG: phosphoheptose isomerase [Acidobacteriota bacterium]